MGVSFMQKIRLALRGWSRRRAEEEQRKQQDFLRRNMQWGAQAAAQPAAPAPPAQASQVLRGGQRPEVDVAGLQAAYLDASGQIVYYLDIESGDVVESRTGEQFEPSRYKRVPVRADNDIDERRAFIATLEPSDTRQELMKNVASSNFRAVLATNRTIERAWYNFRNARATAAIETWLKASGLR